MNSNQDQNNDETIDIEDQNSTSDEYNEYSTTTEDKYKFGWSSYSEITNGRFAMLGFIANLELLSLGLFFFVPTEYLPV